MTLKMLTSLEKCKVISGDNDEYFVGSYHVSDYKFPNLNNKGIDIIAEADTKDELLKNINYLIDGINKDEKSLTLN